jgi:hypothetical protein
MTSCVAERFHVRGALTALLMLACVGSASAHEFRIAYLELRELEADRYAVSWRAPVQPATATVLSLDAHLDCRLDAGRDITLDRLRVRDYVLDCTAAADGGWLALRGLEQVPDDALATVVHLDGSERSQHLRGERQRIDLAVSAAAADEGSLFADGIAHVLGGYDHLLYIGLLFLFLRRDARQLLIGVTAFTLAHSLTLALAATGWLRLPVRPVEAVIALTIAYFAVALLRGQRPLGAAWRWQAVIVLCGLVHGMGFANSLAELGLARGSLLWGLFTFNLGIEAAQLACVGAAFAAAHVAQRLASAPAAGALLERGFALGAGAVGAFWYFDRLPI